MNSDPSLFEKIGSILSQHPDILFATVFGSAIKNRLTPESDLDIAVAAEKALSYEQREDLYAHLVSELPYEIDLVDLHVVYGPLLQQAICGKIIKKTSNLLFAALMKKMWYNQEDMMPYTRRIMKERLDRWLK